MKFAYVLIHFGSNIKYSELELYFIFMLKSFTKYDCIYLYAENDTPKEWANIMKNYFDKVIGFNDNEITLNPKGNFTSHYQHFNTLRTCDYIFSYNLTEYDRICIVESDMVIMESIDDIFKLNIPSVLFVKLNKNLINLNKNILPLLLFRKYIEIMQSHIFKFFMFRL